MNLRVRYSLILFSLLVFSCSAYAQANQYCQEENLNAPINSPNDRLPFIYGNISLKGFQSGAKLPRVTVMLLDTQSSPSRWTIDKSGNYCLRMRTRSGGILVVEVDGMEVARRNLSAYGPSQQREDFEISQAQLKQTNAPGVVSAKYYYPVNPKTADLYRKTAEAESKKDAEKAIEHLTKIVSIDPSDFIGWAKLGIIYLEKNSFPESEAALKKSVEIKAEYTPAWIHIGLLRVAQKQFDAASETFKHVTKLEPASPTAFRLLGEAYLQARKGTLAVEALNKAIQLDPVGMAECHLLLGRLYDLAGAKPLATREYKLFLSKVPDHPDKKKFEKFIKDNPE